MAGNDFLLHRNTFIKSVLDLLNATQGFSELGDNPNDIFNDDANRFDIRALKHLFAYFCLCDDMNND